MPIRLRGEELRKCDYFDPGRLIKNESKLDMTLFFFHFIMYFGFKVRGINCLSLNLDIDPSKEYNIHSVI